MSVRLWCFCLSLMAFTIGKIRRKTLFPWPSTWINKSRSHTHRTFSCDSCCHGLCFFCLEVWKKIQSSIVARTALVIVLFPFVAMEKKHHPVVISFAMISERMWRTWSRLALMLSLLDRTAFLLVPSVLCQSHLFTWVDQISSRDIAYLSLSEKEDEEIRSRKVPVSSNQDDSHSLSSKWADQLLVCLLRCWKMCLFHNTMRYAKCWCNSQPAAMDLISPRC